MYIKKEMYLNPNWKLIKIIKFDLGIIYRTLPIHFRQKTPNSHKQGGGCLKHGTIYATVNNCEIIVKQALMA